VLSEKNQNLGKKMNSSFQACKQKKKYHQQKVGTNIRRRRWWTVSFKKLKKKHIWIKKKEMWTLPNFYYALHMKKNSKTELKQKKYYKRRKNTKRYEDEDYLEPWCCLKKIKIWVKRWTLHFKPVNKNKYHQQKVGTNIRRRRWRWTLSFRNSKKKIRSG